MLFDLEHSRSITRLAGHVLTALVWRAVAHSRCGRNRAALERREWRAVAGLSWWAVQFSDAIVAADGTEIIGAASDGALWFWGADGRVLWTLQANATRVIGLHAELDDLVTRSFGGEVARWSIPPAQGVLPALKVPHLERLAHRRREPRAMSEQLFVQRFR